MASMSISRHLENLNAPTKFTKKRGLRFLYLVRILTLTYLSYGYGLDKDYLALKLQIWTTLYPGEQKKTTTNQQTKKK